MLTGTFTAGHFQEMKQTEAGTWQGSFRLGVMGEEEFQISRDGDVNQLIYPAKSGAVKTTVPVRGPDSFGKKKYWQIRGMPGEELTVTLEVSDGHLRVTVASDVRGDKVWESEDGWERHSYHVYGSWTNWVPVTMVMDAQRPGIFRAFGKIQSRGFAGFMERFYIIVDEDIHLSLYPQLTCSRPYEQLCCT
jgi:hypothetical protein